jgi:hypothetical protein
MARMQSMLAFLVFVVVPLTVLGAQPTTPNGRLTPVPKDLVAKPSQAGDVGYAETDSDLAECVDEGACCPKWTVDAGVVFFTRNAASGRPSAVVDQVTYSPFSVDQIFDMAGSGLTAAVGPDIALSRCLGPCWDLNARFFQIDGWNNRRNFEVSSPNFMGITAYNTDWNGQTISMGYASRLYNVELNLRWKRCERVPLIAGFRMLGLDEEFRFGGAYAGGSYAEWANTRTNNVLCGGQIGAEPVLWDRCGRFRLDGVVKAGIFGNYAHQRTLLTSRGLGLESQADSVPSFVGELGLIGTCKLNECWSIRGGYEVLWITNLALAPDQASTVQYVRGGLTGHIYDKATALYHGATVSVERKF